MIGLEYKKSVIYGGWRNTIYLNNTQVLINRSVSVYRIVNFTDKFYQVCGLAGFYFSSNNKFGYALYFPIGINIQGRNNSHYIKEVRGVGAEFEKKNITDKKGLTVGINMNLFYNFRL